jgi:serine/threonine protein kinase
MEYALNGELFDHIIRGSSGYPIEVVHFIFCKLVNVLEYMKQLNLAHMDIKSENILLDKDFEPKLGDFGFSIDVTKVTQSRPATLSYAPPELVVGETMNGHAVDVFCLAVTAMQMAVRANCIHKEAHSLDYYYSLLCQPGKREKLRFFDIFRRELPEDFKEMILGMMEYDKNKRWTLSDIQACEFYKRPLMNKSDYTQFMTRRLTS